MAGSRNKGQQRDHAGAERDHKALDASAACEPRFDAL
jgi:hypothetical protein